MGTLLEVFQKAEQRAVLGDFGKKGSASKDCETWLLLAAACCRCSAESWGSYFPAVFYRRGEDSARSASSFIGTSYMFAPRRTMCCPLSNLPRLSE